MVSGRTAAHHWVLHSEPVLDFVDVVALASHRRWNRLRDRESKGKYVAATKVTMVVRVVAITLSSGWEKCEKHSNVEMYERLAMNDDQKRCDVVL